VRAFVDTSYYRDESNLDTYDYSRYQLMVGIEAVLENRFGVDFLSNGKRIRFWPERQRMKG